MSNIEYAKRLKEGLTLETPPVAVKFLRAEETPPEGFPVPAKKMRFCQAIMEAGWGKTQTIIPADLACGPGPGYFGLPMKEKVAKGEVHQATGLFETAGAASRSLAGNVKMMSGTAASVMVGPLDKFPVQPDTVVLKTNAEQAMWIVHSRSYSEGKHLMLEVQTEGSFCSGVSVAAHVKGEIQIGFGCFGSRSFTNMGPNEMLVGIPFSLLPKVVDTLEKLKKPIEAERGKKGFYESYPEMKPAQQT